jgi:hypothetical protein
VISIELSGIALPRAQPAPPPPPLSPLPPRLMTAPHQQVRQRRQLPVRAMHACTDKALSRCGHPPYPTPNPN